MRLVTTQPLIFLGHSHLIRLADALGRRAIPPPSATVQGLSAHVHVGWISNGVEYAASAPDGGVAFNPALLDRMRELTLGSRKIGYVTLFGGNAHVLFGWSKPDRPFDFVLPERPDLPLDPTAELRPYGDIRAAVQPGMGAYLWQLIALRQAVIGPVICVETPPPYADDDYVRSHVGSYIHDPAKLVSATLRWKLWRVHSHILADHCKAHGVEFLQVPPEALDGQGFMVREGYDIDASHGNQWYGERVLRQIERRFSARFSSYAQFS